LWHCLKVFLPFSQYIAITLDAPRVQFVFTCNEKAFFSPGFILSHLDVFEMFFNKNVIGTVGLNLVVLLCSQLVFCSVHIGFQFGLLNSIFLHCQEKTGSKKFVEKLKTHGDYKVCGKFRIFCSNNHWEKGRRKNDNFAKGLVKSAISS